MLTPVRIKLIFMLLILSAAIYGLYPTIKYYSMDNAQKIELELSKDPSYSELKTQILNLGLDLQGGMSLVVELDVEKFLLRLAKRDDEPLKAAIKIAAQDEIDPIATLNNELKRQNLSLSSYFSQSDTEQQVSEENLISNLKENLEKARKQALEIINNRIDQFGVAEPNIQRLGDSRISIEIAGDVDQDRVRRNIFREARLNFSILAEPDEAVKVFTAANNYYRSKFNVAKSDSNKTDSVKSDTKQKQESAEDLFGGQKQEELKDSIDLTDAKTYDDYLFLPISQENVQRVVVLAKNKSIADDLLADEEFQKHIRKEAGNFRILYFKNTQENNQSPEYYFLSFVKSRVELTGEGIIDSKWSRDPQGINEYIVTMKFDDKSSRTFSILSERYLNKQLAIILDDVIQSAPVFREKIPAGSGATISGMNQKEAQDISIVLKSGSLPAPLKLIVEQTVSATLGADAIQAGTTSMIFALILVLVFMIVYYQNGGIFSCIALIINVILMSSILSLFNGTLTLPGIAGIILTIGMAVDANVIIFERLREELANGSRVISALENAYSRAIVAILDSNITTFIAGVVLYSFGSGQIRGFALTLMIGIITSLLSAVTMTKVMYEMTVKPTDTTINIG